MNDELGEAWKEAESLLPPNWRMCLLSLDLVMEDGSEQWHAAACLYDERGQPQDRRGDEYYEQAWGPSPLRALKNLATALR